MRNHSRVGIAAIAATDAFAAPALAGSGELRHKQQPGHKLSRRWVPGWARLVVAVIAVAGCLAFAARSQAYVYWDQADYGASGDVIGNSIWRSNLDGHGGKSVNRYVVAAACLRRLKRVLVEFEPPARTGDYGQGPRVAGCRDEQRSPRERWHLLQPESKDALQARTGGERLPYRRMSTCLLLAEQAPDLEQSQRVTVGGGPQLPSDRRREVRPRLAGETDTGVLVQAGHRQLLDPRALDNWELFGAHAREHPDRHARRSPGDEQDRLARRTVQPVEIISQQ